MPRTYRDYDKVIVLFKDYLNHYGYQYLDSDVEEKFDEQFEEDENCFTKLFGQDKLTPTAAGEFLDYFVIHKVIVDAEFMKKCV
ncbi:hypothetical protein GH741_02520 [Aquibacillus halophilus]|uniref:Uncharacterized protein n=1 Tax=Aquibacillus halophilus TaxID=930132 RepID=A0A6A8DAH5_9BACI|nr:hypothetical protein [Aquibacillus halophilus]MRH41546.1 hypothetical protein [Aquibacillus halophilus]